MSNTVKLKQNDSLYIIGGLYEFRDRDGQKWELGALNDVDGLLFRSDTGVKKEWYKEIREVKINIGTITKAPIKLEDGAAYQFDYCGKTNLAHYGNHMNRLYYSGGFISADVCTNIVKLVPEVSNEKDTNL